MSGAAATPADADLVETPAPVHKDHPLAQAAQVKHILGSAAHAARAFELAAGDDPAAGDDHIKQARILAPAAVVEVLRRYPAAPPGGGRAGELIRQLDASLR